MPIIAVDPKYNLPRYAIYLSLTENKTIKFSGSQEIVHRIASRLTECCTEVPFSKAPELFSSISLSHFDKETNGYFLPLNLFQNVTQTLVAQGVLPTQSETYPIFRVGFNTLDEVVGDVHTYVFDTERTRSVEKALTLALYHYSWNEPVKTVYWVNAANSYSQQPVPLPYFKFTSLARNYLNSSIPHAIKIRELQTKLFSVDSKL